LFNVLDLVLVGIAVPRPALFLFIQITFFINRYKLTKE